MKLAENKKGQETTLPWEQIIIWIILGALVLFAILWYSGILGNIIGIGKSYLK